jgi:hypothetical protein
MKPIHLSSFCLLPFLLLLLTCENKEEPVQFELNAEPAYAFSETANVATFSITSNIPWQTTLTNGGEWCRITPASGKGDEKIEITVTANTAYLQERTAAIVVKAGEFSHEITVTQAPPPCPAFDAGSVAATGQTVFTGETPETIHSVQDATGGGEISYQWYKNDNPISGATAANYTPPLEDAGDTGAHTYTRRAKDNICNTTFMPSAGSWVLNVAACSPGAIATAGQTVVLGGTPETIHSVQDATGSGEVSYQWYKNGVAISGATATNYTPPPADVTTLGACTYTRRAKDNTCNTALTQSAGSWALTVICASFNAGVVEHSGQTVTLGGTPETIHSVQDATGSGEISYQWYKNGVEISGATAASYTPPQADANMVGVHTYTRRAKDNTCNTALTQSAGSWALTVICGFNAGAIDPAGQTIVIGSTPATINSAQNATGGDGVISYQWYKDGVEISGATAANYTPPPADAATLGAYTYTRRAKDNTCNTELTPSAGSWALTVATCIFNAGAIATTGQTVAVGGTPVTINSVQNATGGDGVISYQWYKNGGLISGATAASYTPPPADANTVGAHTYTRRAKDNTCQTAFAQSEGSWALTVFCPAFDAGAIASDGQTVCSGNAVNPISSSTDASGGDGNITYQWRRNGSTVSGSAATYNPTSYNTTAGTHTFTRWAHDGHCNTAWAQSAGSWTLLVTANAQLTLTAGTNTLYVANGAAITPIKYTTMGVSTVTVTGLPAGVIYDWTSNTLTISGTSTATGTHAFVITATGASGCSNQYASGSIMIYPEGIDGYGCVPSSINLGTVGFASTVTHVVSGAYGSQTWSAPVTATYCDKTTYSGSGVDGYAADCRSNAELSYGHLFSWCSVVQYAEVLCPSPCRVPTREDMCIMVRNIMGVPSCSVHSAQTAILAEWGASLSGYSFGPLSVSASGTGGYYWTRSAMSYGRSYIKYVSLSNRND